jgi:CheY-specific phosphatase CheX
MDRAPSELLSGVIVETLEKMAFMFATPGEGPGGAQEDELESVEVGFDGPFSGRLQLGLSGSLLAELAGNMLGVEEAGALSPEGQFDALRELANVVVGNLLPLLAGAEAEFAIGPPRRIARGAAGLGPGAVETRLRVEEGFCRGAFAWTGPTAADRAGQGGGPPIGAAP